LLSIISQQSGEKQILTADERGYSRIRKGKNTRINQNCASTVQQKGAALSSAF